MVRFEEKDAEKTEEAAALEAWKESMTKELEEQRFEKIEIGKLKEEIDRKLLDYDSMLNGKCSD